MKQTKNHLRPIALALILVFSGGAMADDERWDCSHETSVWNDEVNWVGPVPRDIDKAIIDGAGKYQPVFEGEPAYAISGLEILGNSDSSKKDASLEIKAGTLSVTGNTTVMGQGGKKATLKITNGALNTTGSVSVDGSAGNGAASMTVGQSGRLTAGSVNLNRATFTSAGTTNVKGEFKVEDSTWIANGRNTVDKLTNIGSKIDVTSGWLIVDGTDGITLTGSSSNGATLTVGIGGTLTVTKGNIALNGAGGHDAKLAISGSNANAAIANGNLTAKAGTNSGEDVSIDVIQGSLTLDGGFLEVTGSANANATLTVGDANSGNSGTLSVTKGNVSLTDVTGTIHAGSALNVSSGSLDLKAANKATSLDAGGTLNVMGGVMLKGANGTETATLTAEKGSKVTIKNDVTLKNFSKLSIKSNTGDFSVIGDIVGNGGDTGTPDTWGTLSFDQSGEQMLANDIVGKLNLATTVYDGITILKGKTTHTGTTSIASDSTLELKNDGNLSSSAATIHGKLDLKDITGDTAMIKLATSANGVTHTGTVITGKTPNLNVDFDTSEGSGSAIFTGRLADSVQGNGTNLIVTNSSGNDARLILTTVAQNYEGDTLVQAKEGNGHVTLALGKGGIDNAGSIEKSRNLELDGANADAKAIFAIDGIEYAIKDSSWLQGDVYSALEVNGTSGVLTIGSKKDWIFPGDIGGDGNGHLVKTGTGAWTLSGGTQGKGLAAFDVTKGRVTLQGTNVSKQTTTGAGTLTATNLSVQNDAVFELHGNATVKGAVSLAKASSAPALEIRTAGDPQASANAIGASMGSLYAKDHMLRVFIDNDPAFYTVGNQTILTLTDSNASNFENASLEIFSVDPLGDTLNLIDGAGTTNAHLDQAHYYAQNGFLTQYILEPLPGTPGQFRAHPKGTEQAKALSEGFLSGVGLLNLGGDLLMDKGVTSAARGVAHHGGAGESFAVLASGQIRHETGSHVDVSGKTLVAGLAAGVDSGRHHATVGAFIEYGDGDYDSYNSFSRVGKVHGSGNTEYFGGGVLARLDLAATPDGQSYLEATARFGRVESDFQANDFEAYAQSAVRSSLQAGYEVKSNYHGLSFGGGHIWNLGKDKTLDVYGRYVWTHRAGDTARLKVLFSMPEEEIRFSDVNSHRLRIGTRYSAAWGKNTRAYAGAAWEHEFDGKADARVRRTGAKIDAPDLTGSTGIVELGLVFTPTDSKNLSIDLSLQGHTGKREGVTGSAQLKYAF